MAISTTTITATGYDISLGNAGNDFGSSLRVSGRNVTLSDLDDITLGASSVSGNSARKRRCVASRRPRVHSIAARAAEFIVSAPEPTALS